MLFASQVALADTPCTSALIIPQVPLFFYAHSLGSYDISLADTLNAIETGRAGGALPYEKKVWTGSCPAGLDSGVGDCIEFTVYPNFAKYPQTNDNFTNGPVPIMQKLSNIIITIRIAVRYVLSLMLQSKIMCTRLIMKCHFVDRIHFLSSKDT